MKFFKIILSIIAICTIGSINPMRTSTNNSAPRTRQSNAYATQTRQPKPTPPTPIKTPVKPLIIEEKQPSITEDIFIKKFATNNLIMLLDPDKVETINNTERMLVQDALIALCEKAAPIIMSSNIFEIITTLRQKIGDHALQQLRNTNNNNQLLISLLSLIDFDNKTFICCLHTSENLVLIIPKQYITANIMDSSNISIQNQIKSCGFNPSVAIPIDDLSSQNILYQLKVQQTKPPHKEQFINKLTSLFIPQKENGKLISPTQDTPWIIYAAGHGGALYQSIGTIRGQLKINKQNFIFFEKALSENKNDNEAKEKIAISEKNIKKYEKIIHNKSNWPDSQLLVGEANIAGVDMDDFSSLMEFFDKKLNVYYLHYTSCLDGGYKQAFVNEILSSLDVDFITSTQGVDERNITGISCKLSFDAKKQPSMILTTRPFSAFFKLLRTFIEKPEDFVKAKKYKKEPFAYVLSTIISTMDQHNQPFIRFPGAGVFGALSLGKTTKNLTNALVKAHEIENSPIDLTDTTINIVTINPSCINVPLNFGKNEHCAIVSPTPATIPAFYEAVHIFKEINFENTLQALLFNFVSLNARIHKQTFIVKRLTGILCQQSGLQSKPGGANTINNLIIQMRSIPEQTIQAHAGVIFELNGNICQAAIEINNFEDPVLQKKFAAITFTSKPMATMDMESLASKFLTLQEVNRLKKPISLESIIQYHEAKTLVKKPSIFSQPDSDNEALRDFLERKPK